MWRLLLLTGLLVLSLSPCLASDYTQPVGVVRLAAAGQQATELQKQSDHHNRVIKEKEEREVEKQVAAVGATRTEARALDNVVMIMLVVSAGALFFISRRVHRGRRKKRRYSQLPLG